MGIAIGPRESRVITMIHAIYTTSKHYYYHDYHNGYDYSHPFGVAHPEASALTIGCSHLSASRRTTFLVHLRSRGVVAEDQLRSYLFTGTLRKYYVANRYLALSK